VILQLGGWANTSPLKKACYEMLQMASELAGSCENGYESSGSIKDEEFLD
jgi:hypothetical protein